MHAILLKTIATALTAISLAWPGTHYSGGKGPETEEQRSERMAMLAEVEAVVAVVNDTELDPEDDAALIQTVWGHESRLDYFVHAGLPSPLGTQDDGLARCLGQIHTWKNNRHLPTKADHQALAGLDREATERCARTTLAYFWGHAQRCIRTRYNSVETRWKEPLMDWEVAILMASYGAGHCAPVAKKHKERAATFRRIRKAIDKQKLEE